jgi:cobyrinic acid a,c-diamide synthase
MEALELPRLVIAGTASGVGKTTVMVALTEALRRRGRRVAVFKCGPDYLDPTYHARAAGAACHNLDGWMMGREAVLSTFARVARLADVALIEGVMGLYDGAAPDSEDGSAAQIARWLDAPVLAVVDASGMARTVAAIGLGLATFDSAVQIAGVFCNRVGSLGHVELLRSACAHRGAPPVLGSLPARKALAFPERHLGLRTADREAVSDEQLAAWGAIFDEWCDADALWAVARAARPVQVPTLDEPVRPTRCRIGIARDAAFHFYYEDNLRRLKLLGAELVQFSPLSDRELPDVDGLYLGGGYPELFAVELSSNRGVLDGIRAFAGRGAPVYAECGGLMLLARAIRTLDGREHEMAGVIDGVAVMGERLQALGYVEVETRRRTVLGGAGLRFRGHQFRYSSLERPEPGDAYSVRKRRGGSTEMEGHGGANVLASYVHAHWASNPLCAEGFVATCAAWAESRR